MFALLTAISFSPNNSLRRPFTGLSTMCNTEAFSDLASLLTAGIDPIVALKKLCCVEVFEGDICISSFECHARLGFALVLLLVFWSAGSRLAMLGLRCIECTSVDFSLCGGSECLLLPNDLLRYT